LSHWPSPSFTNMSRSQKATPHSWQISRSCRTHRHRHSAKSHVPDEGKRKINGLNAYVNGIGATKRIVVWDTTAGRIPTTKSSSSSARKRTLCSQPYSQGYGDHDCCAVLRLLGLRRVCRLARASLRRKLASAGQRLCRGAASLPHRLRGAISPSVSQDSCCNLRQHHEPPFRARSRRLRQKLFTGSSPTRRRPRLPPSMRWVKRGLKTRIQPLHRILEYNHPSFRPRQLRRSLRSVGQRRPRRVLWQIGNELTR